MKKLVLPLFLMIAGVAAGQIRPFDNSKAILPWIYNPAASFAEGFQAYIGYDGRGSGNFLPQSVVAGLRMPVLAGRRSRHSPTTMVGVQLLKTTQDLLKASTINATFAHQISLTRTMKIAMGLGAGVYNMRYNFEALEYMDANDPLLNSGKNFFNMHLNAGAALVMDDKFFVNLAFPYLVKDNRANLTEIIFRAGYEFALNPDLALIASANLDTYNHNLIFGGDLRAEWRKMVSFIAGADRYKYHGGILLDIKPFSLGYTYGLNFSSSLDNVPSHQISVFSDLPLRR
jgi:hypothetical protein